MNDELDALTTEVLRERLHDSRCSGDERAAVRAILEARKVLPDAAARASAKRRTDMAALPPTDEARIATVSAAITAACGMFARPLMDAYMRHQLARAVAGLGYGARTPFPWLMLVWAAAAVASVAIVYRGVLSSRASAVRTLSVCFALALALPALGRHYDVMIALVLLPVAALIAFAAWRSRPR